LLISVGIYAHYGASRTCERPQRNPDFSIGKAADLQATEKAGKHHPFLLYRAEINPEIRRLGM
jgi:hypothetical protein